MPTYLVNYHLHLRVREPALEPGTVVTLDLTPEQEQRLIGHSLTPLPNPEPAKPRRRRTKAGEP